MFCNLPRISSIGKSEADSEEVHSNNANLPLISGHVRVRLVFAGAQLKCYRFLHHANREVVPTKRSALMSQAMRMRSRAKRRLDRLEDCLQELLPVI